LDHNFDDSSKIIIKERASSQAPSDRESGVFGDTVPPTIKSPKAKTPEQVPSISEESSSQASPDRESGVFGNIVAPTIKSPKAETAEKAPSTADSSIHSSHSPQSGEDSGSVGAADSPSHSDHSVKSGGGKSEPQDPSNSAAVPGAPRRKPSTVLGVPQHDPLADPGDMKKGYSLNTTPKLPKLVARIQCTYKQSRAKVYGTVTMKLEEETPTLKLDGIVTELKASPLLKGKIKLVKTDEKTNTVTAKILHKETKTSVLKTLSGTLNVLLQDANKSNHEKVVDCAEVR